MGAKDEENAITTRREQRSKDLAQLRMIFAKADVDGGGNVSLNEFKRITKDPRIENWLAGMGLDVNEVNSLFGLLDDGDGAVSLDEFLSGAMRIRGQAKSADLVSFMYENRR